MAQQSSFFAPEPPPALPEGMRVTADLISPPEERTLIAAVAALPFRPFEFQGFVGKRRVVSFGWEYDFNGGGLQPAAAMPAFLLPVREKAAAFAGLAPDDLPHALLLDYPPGATINWHRDRAVFGKVIGVSLGSPCTFRLRRKNGPRWERASFVAQPRSAYLLDGPARTEWEHSIPAVAQRRYSITFRTLKARPAIPRAPS